MQGITRICAAAAFALTTVVAVLAPRSSPADSVTLLDGRVIEGTVVDKGENYEVVVPNGTFTIPKTSVSKVVIGQASAQPKKAELEPPKSGEPENKKGKDPDANPAVSPPSPAKEAATPPLTKSPTAPPADLLKEAEEATAKKLYPHARSCLQLIVKFHPDAPEAPRARALLREIPAEDGRLILGFDSQEETAAQILGKGGAGIANHVEWISDPKVAPDGKGCAHIVLKGPGAHAKFPIPSQTFATMKGMSFWVWSVAPIVGMTGTTYVCLYTDDPGDYLLASWQLRGDGEWRRISIEPLRWKRKKETLGRRFTAIGFWNQSPEIRDFLVDEIRVVEEDPPLPVSPK